MRMPEGQQEFAAAGIDIQDAHVGREVPEDGLPVIPRKVIVLCVPPGNMGEVPAEHVRGLFFLFPERDEVLLSHGVCSCNVVM